MADFISKFIAYIITNIYKKFKQLSQLQKKGNIKKKKKREENMKRQ